MSDDSIGNTEAHNLNTTRAPAVPLSPPHPAHGAVPLWQRRTVEVLHLMTSLALALFYLAPGLMLLVAATGVGLTLAHPWLPETLQNSTNPTLWTIPIHALLLPMAATLLARLACQMQRHRLDTVFGIVEAGPPTPDLLTKSTLPVRIWRLLFGQQAWTMVAYSTVAGLHALLIAGTTVLLVVCGGAAALGSLIGLVLILIRAGTPADLWTPLLLLLAGPIVVLLGLHATPYAISTEVRLHRTLLLDTPEVQVRRRLLHVQDSRLRMVDAAEAERRRIERDLHDGAQQHLLALTLTLTRARVRISKDPEQALALITEAQNEAKQVMEELRQVAKGLHPRVLTDHGLASALPVAAERCPVPVRLQVLLPERPSKRAEGVAYYVVCEALTNVTKHARATRVDLVAEHLPQPEHGTEGLLQLTVTDDGCGGADPEVGTGLYGLWDRLDAVDGSLTVHSPPGKGTVLTAHIPWKA